MNVINSTFLLLTPYERINEFIIYASVIGFLLFFIAQIMLCSKAKNEFITKVPLHMLLILLLAMICAIITCFGDELFKTYVVVFGMSFAFCVLGVILAWLCYTIKKAIIRNKNKKM